LKPIVFDIVQGEADLVSHSGLSLAGALLQRTQIQDRINQIALPTHTQPEMDHGEIAHAMIGLLCLGKPDFEAIEAFRDDSYFPLAMGLKRIPSEGTLRQRLDDANGTFDEILLEESAAMVKRHAPSITPCYQDYVALDVDVSPFDNSSTQKEGVSCTYKKVDGYAPIFAYLGKEGYLINAELREGKQHCQEGTVSFLRESLQLSRRVTDQAILVRLDAGNDSLENLQLFQTEKADWIVKRNLRRESSEDWLAKAQSYGQSESSRAGKIVYRGEVYEKREGVDDPLRIIFQVTLRTSEDNGQETLFPDIDVETYWTSLSASPSEVIRLYHDHAMSEQFHSELKTDMDLERLPSGKFATNALVLRLGLVAYNCLRLCGQESLREEVNLPPQERAPIRKKVQRRRLRSVMQDLMYMACRLVYHARKYRLSFGRSNRWYGVWRRIYRTFTCRPIIKASSGGG
jgi:hypothetical protein